MIWRISFPACGCKLTQKASDCQEIQWESRIAILPPRSATGWLCTVLLGLEMLERRVHCWPPFSGINTEYTEKSHRGHRGSNGEEEYQTAEEKRRFLCGSL